MIKQEGGEWIIDSKNSIILKGDIKIIEKGKKKFYSDKLWHFFC